MTYIRELLLRKSLMLAVVLLVCSVVACTINNEDDASNLQYGDAAMMNDGLIGKAYKSAMLMGDIDVISTVAADKHNTVRHSGISTYITTSTMNIGDFPCQEILTYLPGAVADASASVSMEYTRENLPATFNYRTDYLKMELIPEALNFAVNMEGRQRTVTAEFTVDDGKMTYEEMIHWKYHFIMRLSAISVDGEAVETYNSMPDNAKLVYVYNAWVINYNVF